MGIQESVGCFLAYFEDELILENTIWTPPLMSSQKLSETVKTEIVNQEILKYNHGERSSLVKGEANPDKTSVIKIFCKIFSQKAPS